MVNYLDISSGDNVIEIGGGKGAITRELIRFSDILGSLKIYEIDKDLSVYLDEIAKDKVNVQVVYKDFLDRTIFLPNNVKVIGSIPYYITSPIIHKLLSSKERPLQVLLLIQEEVAKKMVGSKPNYWSFITLGYNVKKLFDVSPDNFYPVPKVTSALIRMDLNQESNEVVKRIGFDNWSKFLHYGFSKPRKMLNKVFDERAMKMAGLNPKKRPHELELSDWLRLYGIMHPDEC